MKMETKNSVCGFDLVDNFSMGQMHIGLLFVQRNEMSVYLQQNRRLQKDGEVSLGWNWGMPVRTLHFLQLY